MTSAPRAEQRPHETTYHGVSRTDPYAWLRADNWQEVMRAPDKLPRDIRDHLEAENAFTEAVMAPSEALQKTLFEEMKGRIKEDDSAVPSPDGPWAYYSSFVTGGEYPRVCRRPRDGGDEQILLDGNALGEGHEYFSLGGASHSPNHRYMVYGTDTKGSEYYTLRVRDLETGKDLEDEIADTGGGGTWARDNRTFFYTRLDENHRPHAIYRHRLGTPAADDVLVYEEKDPGFFAGVDATQSGELVLIETHTHETSEVWLIDAHNPDEAPRLVAAREERHEYDVEHQGDMLIIRTNRDGADDFKICAAPVSDPGLANWREIEPHRVGRLILGVTAYADYLVRLEREDGLPRIVIRARHDDAEHAIAFDEEAYSLGMSGGYEFDTTRLRFTYSSMTTPSQVFDYDMAERTRTLRKTQEVPSGHDPSRYVTRRIMAPAHDGETVPISLLSLRDTPQDGSAPLLLYGYGSYGISMPAGFSTNRLSLVDRGFVYAIAHIRGGREKGHRWYVNGKRSAKMNTFRDFVSAGEHLAKEKYTSRGRIVAHGGSAGGLLVGASVNLAPDLFAGVIAEVPFVDALTTMLDDTLPLTPPEWPEWGNPIESADAYRDIAAYAPYENIRATEYPAILALAGLTDPRVTYWEPAKWITRLRELATGDTDFLLKTNMGAGHGGASGRFERLHEVALAYAFALKVTNSAST
ncbi:MAG: S9 family peptidase [Pseudomonadota bacterium]